MSGVIIRDGRPQSAAPTILNCRILNILGFDIEVDAAADHFFKGNPSWFVLLRIDLDSRLCATLKLLASLRCEDD